MPIRQHNAIAANATEQTARVMVAVIAGSDAPGIDLSENLPHWQRLTPFTIWATVNLRDTTRAEILHKVAALLERQGMPARQLILLGEGIAARCALQLVLEGALDCGGVLASRASFSPLPSRSVASPAP